MSERTAIYKEKLNSRFGGTYKIYRISETRLFGPAAMSEVGAPCPDWVEVGWYYNESSNVFLSPEQYNEPQKTGSITLPPIKFEPNSNSNPNPKEPFDPSGVLPQLVNFKN